MDEDTFSSPPSGRPQPPAAQQRDLLKDDDEINRDLKDLKLDDIDPAEADSYRDEDLLADE
jgi:hypothetical protein